jgi:enoyl-CoA hydratase
MTESAPTNLILAEIRGRVGIATLNRPTALNALNAPLMAELIVMLSTWDADSEIGCMVITGSDKAFAAGADIKQMATATAVEMLDSPFIGYWDTLTRLRKPIIAAVSGWCLGGGCELAMACDIIVASETAKFGQPEVNIGVIPGAGGTQRLTRAVGKSLAMEMILADRRLNAEEALRCGLVSRVEPVETYMQTALELAATIASKSPVAIRAAKEAINHSYEGSLAEGMALERRLFSLLFASEDQKEGMAAFIEKRPPQWTGR